MCAPRIVRMAHDSAVHAARLSRRGLFGALGVVAAAVPVAAPASARSGSVVDLTHTLSPELPVWPGNPPFATIPVGWHAVGGFNRQALALWEHTGTHVDAPIHRDPGGISVDKLPAQDLVAPLIVLDISARAASDADTMVTVADIDAFEARHGRIPERAFVAMYSGWERRLAAPAAFLNLDAGGTPHAPGFAADAAKFLVTQRNIVGAGVDTLSLDHSSSRDFGAHTAFLGAGRYGVEMLANLAAVPATGATVVVGAPKHSGGTGGPCRVLALT
ncbi:cyclase family protein [Nocardia transvalensis]|uniref:cyclase family protein n=1 Tax=Nocardia transvalensis TaxID=37333 RepID=UPI0018961036|nr:cyclase family protein [Nocardia transvalensis]MBF6328124.1 cyclase family protein [Nocardia transvalensis]